MNQLVTHMASTLILRKTHAKTTQRGFTLQTERNRELRAKEFLEMTMGGILIRMINVDS